MKKVIKARLYLPEKYLDVIYKDKNEYIKYFEQRKIEYDIYLAEIDNENICVLDFVLEDIDKKLVNQKYKFLLEFIKTMTGKKPQQHLKMECDRLF